MHRFSGDDSSGYYYAGLEDQDTIATYGVGADTDPYTWDLNVPAADGHILLWVTLNFPIVGDWIQAGYVFGTIDGTTTSDRVPYVEDGFSSPSPTAQVWSSDVIINNDDGYIEAWSYSYNSHTGDYTGAGAIYSPNYGTVFLYDTMNMGTYDNGVSYVGLENDYAASYSGTCNAVYNYSTTSNQVYTTSVSTSNPVSVGTSWSSCGQWQQNNPYSYSKASGTCDGTIDFYNNTDV